MKYQIELEGEIPSDFGQRQMGVIVRQGEHRRIATAEWRSGSPQEPLFARLIRQVRDEAGAGLIDVDGRNDYHRLDLDPEEYELELDRWLKRCLWQHEDNGRDLYCKAVHFSSDYQGMIYELGDGNVGYETDLATCQECPVPDAHVLCDAFSHPKMSPHNTLGPGKPGHPTEIWSATCRIGNDEVGEPRKCRPGLHECWHQTVDERPSDAQPANGAQLLEAFDFLDSEWRHRSPGNRIVVPTSLAEAARLLEPVQSQADFRDHVVRLGELLQKLKIPADALEGRAPPGSLDRLSKWCEEHAPEGLDAVKRLGQINDLRNSLSHTDPAKRLAAMESLHIGYPPESWEGAWRILAGHAVDALRDLRRAISS